MDVRMQSGFICNLVSLSERSDGMADKQSILRVDTTIGTSNKGRTTVQVRLTSFSLVCVYKSFSSLRFSSFTSPFLHMVHTCL